MYFSRWKIITVIAVIVLGMLIALPNVVSRDTLAKLPGWVPTRQVNLGLDLRGGGYLLLQIDMDTLKKSRVWSSGMMRITSPRSMSIELSR